MAKPKKAYEIRQIGNSIHVYITPDKIRFTAEISSIEGVTFVDYLSSLGAIYVKINPIYDPADIVEEIKVLFLPIPDPFKQAFDE